MAPRNNRPPDDDRARKTLYVTGFNPKLIKKHLLKELFCQGGPVTDVTLFETHAYILFQHAESVPYCLALFNDVEIFGDKLKLKPRCHTGCNPYNYLDYLTEVRGKLREEYSRVKPPSLPAKKYPDDQKKKKKDKYQRRDRRSFDTESDNHDKSCTTVKSDRKRPSNHSLTSALPKSKDSSTTNSQTKKRKRGGKRKTVGSRKLQKKVKYII